MSMRKFRLVTRGRVSPTRFQREQRCFDVDKVLYRGVLDNENSARVELDLLIVAILKCKTVLLSCSQPSSLRSSIFDSVIRIALYSNFGHSFEHLVFDSDYVL